MIDEVCFVFGITTEEFQEMMEQGEIPEEIIHYVYGIWLNMNSSSVTKIIDPVVNGVYPLNISGTVQYYIYYIDYQWYPIDMYRSDVTETIIAQVPVYGYINYKGSIMRSV